MSELTDDQTAKELFGRTLKTAHNAGRCVSCWSKVLRRELSQEDKDNFKKYGFCPDCNATTV